MRWMRWQRTPLSADILIFLLLVLIVNTETARKTDHVLVANVQSAGRLVVLTVKLHGDRQQWYDSYAALPDVVEYEGQLFGKTSWNSDTGDAVYRNDAKFGRV